MAARTVTVRVPVTAGGLATVATLLVPVAAAGVSSTPTLASTGPRTAPSKTISGDFTPAANTAYAGLHITGNVMACNPGFTLTDCVVDGEILLNQYGGPPYYGSWTVPAAGGQKYAYCKIGGISSNGCGGAEFDHCQVINWLSTPISLTPGDPSVKCHDVNIHDCYVAQAKNVPANSGYHIEVVHAFGCTNLTLNNNVFDITGVNAATFAQITSCLNLGMRNGNDSWGMKVTNNWIYGGGFYQAYIYPSGGGPAAQIIGNRCYSYANPSGGTFPPQVYPKRSYTDTGWQNPVCSNNYADDKPWDIFAAMMA